MLQTKKSIIYIILACILMLNMATVSAAENTTTKYYYYEVWYVLTIPGGMIGSSNKLTLAFNKNGWVVQAPLDTIKSLADKVSGQTYYFHQTMKSTRNYDAITAEMAIVPTRGTKIGGTMSVYNPSDVKTYIGSKDYPYQVRVASSCDNGAMSYPVAVLKDTKLTLNNLL